MLAGDIVGAVGHAQGGDEEHVGDEEQNDPRREHESDEREEWAGETHEEGIRTAEVGIWPLQNVSRGPVGERPKV